VKRSIGAVLLLLATASLTTGCEDKQVGDSRPPAPVQVSVSMTYSEPKGDQIGIQGATISASPNTVGAGPVNFVVSNTSNRRMTFKVASASLPATGASPHGQRTAGPIDPGNTTELLLDLVEGSYTLGSTGAEVRTAVLNVGSERKSSENQLLLP